MGVCVYCRVQFFGGLAGRAGRVNLKYCFVAKRLNDLRLCTVCKIQRNSAKMGDRVRSLLFFGIHQSHSTTIGRRGLKTSSTLRHTVTFIKSRSSYITLRVPRIILIVSKLRVRRPEDLHLER